jgi:predicted nucleotidyltransferase component of viral defense system
MEPRGKVSRRGRGFRAAFIEKDYYVTEALCLIAGAAGDRTIFKGGTSLSKGWNLIQRFSEDRDISFDPNSGRSPLGRRAIDRELKALRDARPGPDDRGISRDQPEKPRGLAPVPPAAP